MRRYGYRCCPINFGYIPMLACRLAIAGIKLAAALMALSMPLWVAAGIVGLI